MHLLNGRLITLSKSKVAKVPKKRDLVLVSKIDFILFFRFPSGIKQYFLSQFSEFGIICFVFFS